MLSDQKSGGSKYATINWFSSLRRQPKPKKVNKNIQQSCLDLTSISTTSASSLPKLNEIKSNTNSTLLEKLSNNDEKGELYTVTSPSLYSTTSTASISSSSDHNSSQYLCSNCIKANNSLQNRNDKNDIEILPNNPNQQTNVSLAQEMGVLVLPKIPFDKNLKTTIPTNQTVYLTNKQEQFKTSTQITTKTTTTITRTTILNREQLQNANLLNKDINEIISNLNNSRTFLKKQLQNSCQINNINNNINNFKSNLDIIKLAINNNSLNNFDENSSDIKFIDDDSQSFNSLGERKVTKVIENYKDAEEFCDNTSTSGSSASSNSSTCGTCIYNFCSNCNNKISSWNLNSEKQIKDELCEVVTEMEALDSQDDCKHSNSKDKQMSIGRKKFNMDPKKGIEYLVENHLLRMDPQDVADYLYKGEGLNKTAIGDYLGEKNDFNEQVLKAFVELHDFTNLILVQALRQFLWSFRLPGEAQKIDRMMECFAQRYCQLNPDIFTNTDTCYVLSFAIIMLNTSLHNPSVKDKPTVEQFISMNRGINNGGDLPRELLESLYESIRTEPFKIPQDDGNDLMHTFFNPDKEGWLWKQGGRYKSWKRRWFILNDNCLYYFEYTTDKEPRGIIPLENISVREITDRNKPYCFELYACGGADFIKACKTDSEGKVVEGKHTVYRMSAATEEEKQNWIKCLKVSISHNPFYDILVQRKKKALIKS